MTGRIVLSMGAALLALASAAWSADVGEVLGRMRTALEPGRDMRASVELIMTNARGERVTWTGKYYRLDGEHARKRIVFDSPPDLRDVSVSFQREAHGVDSTRVYLPFVRRVRDLRADMRGESFLGTDFNYEDLGLEDLEFQQHTLRDDGEFDGRPCYTVESVPDKSWWYSRVRRCIDKKDFLPRRTEYFDSSGEVYKIRSIDRVEKIGSFPTPMLITMDVVPTGTSSRIALKDVEYNVNLKPALFEGP